MISPGRVIQWIGPRQLGLGWLHERCADLGTVALAESLPNPIHAVPAETDRIIVAFQDRLEFSELPLRQLSRSFPEIPIATALGTWWDGSGRTGTKLRPQHMVAWHRWWDFWEPWLQGEHPDLFSPCPPHHGFMSPAQNRRKIDGRKQGWIVANCSQSAQAWTLVAESAGMDARLMSAQNLKTLDSQNGPPDWLLWDDTCLDTTRGSILETEHAEHDTLGWKFLERVRDRWPDTLLIAAVNMPRWSAWQAAEALGGVELLVKPNTGEGLTRLMHRYFG